MNDRTIELDQADLETLYAQVSDETLEASAGAEKSARVAYSLGFYTCGVNACP